MSCSPSPTRPDLVRHLRAYLAALASRRRQQCAAPGRAFESEPAPRSACLPCPDLSLVTLTQHRSPGELSLTSLPPSAGVVRAAADTRLSGELIGLAYRLQAALEHGSLLPRCSHALGRAWAISRRAAWPRSTISGARLRGHRAGEADLASLGCGGGGGKKKTDAPGPTMIHCAHLTLGIAAARRCRSTSQGPRLLRQHSMLASRASCARSACAAKPVAHGITRVTAAQPRRPTNPCESDVHELSADLIANGRRPEYKPSRATRSTT